MRRSEVLNLRWSQVDRVAGCIRLAPQDTKTEQHRAVFLTKRSREALDRLAVKRLPNGLVVLNRSRPGEASIPTPNRDRDGFVIVNPKTGKPWNNVRKMFARACKAAGIQGAWFHDLRRSFVTNARRRGIAESVVMRMTGHRTRAVSDRYNVVNEEDVKVAAATYEAGAARDLDRDRTGQESGHSPEEEVLERQRGRGFRPRPL